MDPTLLVDIYAPALRHLFLEVSVWGDGLDREMSRHIQRLSLEEREDWSRLLGVAKRQVLRLCRVYILQLQRRWHECVGASRDELLGEKGQAMGCARLNEDLRALEALVFELRRSPWVLYFSDDARWCRAKLSGMYAALVELESAVLRRWGTFPRSAEALGEWVAGFELETRRSTLRL